MKNNIKIIAEKFLFRMCWLFISLNLDSLHDNNFNTNFAVDKNHSFRGTDYFSLAPNYNENRLLEVKT